MIYLFSYLSLFKGASHVLEIEDIKHIAENSKMVGDMVEEIVKEWDAQKEAFYKQTGINHQNEIVAVNSFDEIEHLLNEWVLLVCLFSSGFADCIFGF